jgi:hypothetical protein
VAQVPIILPVPNRKGPKTVGTNPNQGHKGTHSSKEKNPLKHLPLPPAKARTFHRFPTPPQTRKHKQEPEDVVPDSEEGCTVNEGTQYDLDSDNNNNNNGRHNRGKSEADSTDDETSEKEDNDGRFSQDNLQVEMEMDPYAFEDDEELAAMYRGQNQGM